MNSNEILKADFLDILFDSRNKTYGAYALRKNYTLRLEISLLVALGSVFLILFFIRPNHYSNSVYTSPHSQVVVSSVELEPKKIVLPKPDVPSSPKEVAQEEFISPKITEDRKVKGNMVDQKTLLTSLVSDHTFEGPAITGPVTPLITDPSPGGSTVESHPATNIETVQREPEFPGGTKAWLAYLTKNLQPPGELEAGKKDSAHAIPRFSRRGGHRI